MTAVALPTALSPHVIGYLQGLCAASSFHYQEGGTSLDYAMKDGVPPYRPGTTLEAFLHRQAEQRVLPPDQLESFATFLANSLGFYTPGAPELYRARLLAGDIVAMIREDLGAGFMSCSVAMDDNGLSGSADILAIVLEKRCHHVITLDWQLD
jgi:hypothetical protein